MKIKNLLFLILFMLTCYAYSQTFVIVGYTTSDWTSILFDVPPMSSKIVEYAGEVGKCRSTALGIRIDKPAFNQDRVLFKVQLEFNNTPSQVILTKGDIGETYIEIYLKDEDGKLEFIGKFLNNSNIESDPTNKVSFKLQVRNVTSSTGKSFPSKVRLLHKKLVLAFYYAWYGTPDGAMGNGRWLHWYGPGMYYQGTDHPLMGLYDSWDEKVLKKHMQLAADNGIDGFIVSWWGEGSYETDTVYKMLKIANDMKKEGKDFWITVYYEGYDFMTEEEALNDLTFVIDSFAGNPRFLKINGEPAIFIYSRAINGLSKEEWEDVLRKIHRKYPNVVFFADTFDGSLAKKFGGIHNYNVVAPFKTIEKIKVVSEAMLAKARHYSIYYAMDIGPGYDDTHIRVPGTSVSRQNGKLYEELWKLVLQIDPDIVLITSWNEWHEGSEIEPSKEYKDLYIKLTRKWSMKWKGILNDHNSRKDLIDIDKLKSYFMLQFIPEANLLKEALYTRPDSKRIYINENLLAWYVLKILSLPIKDKVREAIEKYGGGYDEKHEVIIGHKIPEKFYGRYIETEDVISSQRYGLIEICYEKSNRDIIIKNWDEYADLIVYKALNCLIDGNIEEAEKLFSKLMKMWDGNGFQDKTYNPDYGYTTYKTALMVILAKRLQNAGSALPSKYKGVINKALKILSNLQCEEGGFNIAYEVDKTGKVQPIDDCNLETTNMVAIALLER